jgi:LEA14-like dessication related protein
VEPIPASRLSRYRLTAVILAIACVCSCAVFQQLRFEEPTVELGAIEITGLGFSGVSLNIWLDVFNPNDYEIGTTRIEADLQLEETHFGSALLEEDVEIAPSSHTRVMIPARFTWEGVGTGVRALLLKGVVNYEMETKLRAKTPLGARTLDFKSRGEVPISDLVR